MADIGQASERRVFPRVEIDKEMTGEVGWEVISGAVADVSVGGIALRTDAKLEIGQEVVLEVENMSPVNGKVFRATDTGFVVSLDLPREAQKKFIAEVMQIQNDLVPDV
ncbi:MAG: PilZ domain-containing protein [Rhodospirillales bacterium]|jgi:hypothetical protein|nr:PilZ domain-containing protein [Rhodospirillales bacterium]